MKHYLLAMHQPVGGPPAPDVLGPIMRNVGAVREEMIAAGVWVFAGGLHGPEASTVLRLQGDHILMTDGPYVEGKEHLGGFTIVQVANLDAALAWGEKMCRASTLPIEVRPFMG